MERLRWIVITILMVGLLTNCGGDDGEDGKPAEVKPVITETTSLYLSVLSVESEAGQLKVNFEATSKEGVHFVGLNKPKMTVAKLIPAKNGDASEWQSFIYNNTGTQATYDSEGEFVDHRNGKYSYTFSNDVLHAAGILWDGRTTHRVGIEVNEKMGRHPVANSVYDWVPSGESLIHTRDIVATETCNGCHASIKKHGGTKLETGYCVTCHNPSSKDVGTIGDSGNTLDFKVMVHKIHMGKALPGIAAQNVGAKYFINNDGAGKYVYAEKITDGLENDAVDGVGFPQDIRNCTNCHVGEDDKAADSTIKAVATLDGDSWENVQNMEACGSCHDDVAFNKALYDTAPYKSKHVPWKQFPVANEDCSLCHAPGAEYSVVEKHSRTLAALKSVNDDAATKISIDGITYDDTSDPTTPKLTVELDIEINGQHPASVDEFLSYASDTPSGYYKGALVSGPVFVINYDQGQGYQTAAVIHRLVSVCTGSVPFTCEINYPFDHLTSEPYSNPSSPIIAPANSTIAVTLADTIFCGETEISSKAVKCDGSDLSNPDASIQNIAAQVPVGYYTVNGTENSNYEEKMAVNRESCNRCHEDLTVHLSGQYSNHAATDFHQCKSCHNGNRNSDHPAPADLKYNVHFKHANGLKSESQQREGYPGIVDNCLACHDEGQFDLPLKVNNYASKTDYNNTFTSPIATVCTSCHISFYAGYIEADGTITAGKEEWTHEEKKTIKHMIRNGAVFAGTKEAANRTEGCSVCHSSGSVLGVDIKHGLAK